MQRIIVLTLLLDFSVGAFGAGTKCAAGRKNKAAAALTNQFCSTSATDATSCDSDCCVDDEMTCGGLARAAKLSCPFDQYAPMSDAWGNKKTTDKTKIADCCLPKVTCANQAYSCDPGFTKKPAADVESLKCSSDPASCAVGTLCCVKSAKTCGGATAQACVAGSYKATDNDAWKKTAVEVTLGQAQPSLVQYRAACCAAAPTCASVTCKAGYKPTTVDADKKKATAAADGVFTELEKYTNQPCCVKNADICANPDAVPPCDASHYYPSTQPEWQNRPKDKCCTAKATCAVAKCPEGYTKKANVDGLSCTSDAASCAIGDKCCVKDTTKCGGLTGITCAYGFYDESTTFVTAGDKKTPQATIDAWKKKPATEATKNTACCTAKAACTAAPAVTGAVTTTPTVVVVAVEVAVTTTPAVAAVRRYSEHGVAVEEEQARPWGPNMAWLGVGCLMGMTVLMVAQGLRSRLQAAPTYGSLGD